MVKVKKDLTGQKFGRLTVMHQIEDYVAPNGQHFAQYRCICDCDEYNEINVTANRLRRGITTSCGCFAKERRHINGKNQFISHNSQTKNTMNIKLIMM